jgi:mxaL protein
MSEERPHWTAHLPGRESIALLVALLLLAAATVMPPVQLPRRTFDHVVVFDVTQSMDVEDKEVDGRPVSRLDFAREAARRALRELPCGSRVGWGAFTEYRTMLLLAPIEVCEHYGDLLAALANVDGRIRWGNASEVSKGLFWAVRAAKELKPQPSLLFLTDGHEAPPLVVTQLPLFDDLKPGEVVGSLLGVGGSVPRPIPRTDSQGQPIGWWRSEEVVQPAGGREHLSELREPHLRMLAEQVGFRYAPLQRVDDLAGQMQDARFARRTPVATDLSWLPAALALLALTLHFRPQRRAAAGLRPQGAPT